jgi:hypothetical protein
LLLKEGVDHRLPTAWPRRMGPGVRRDDAENNCAPYIRHVIVRA